MSYTVSRLFSYRAISFMLFSVVMFGVWPSSSDADTNESEILIENALSTVLDIETRAVRPERKGHFSNALSSFVAIDEIAVFTLGKYARRYSEDEIMAHKSQFRNFISAYIANALVDYPESEFRVLDSYQRRPFDFVVSTEVLSTEVKPISLHWRIMESDDQLRVFDIAIDQDGNVLWLAVELRAQFVSLLDQQGGSAEALSNHLNSLGLSAS